MRTPAALLAVALTCLSARAQPIPIVNASFEDQPAIPSCFIVSGIPTGWDAYDPNTLIPLGGAFFGIIDPAGTTYFLPGQLPDGPNAALLFFNGSIGQGPIGIRQTLPDVLLPDRRYRLTVGVGNIASGASPSPPCPNGDFFDLDGFPGYHVQLLAGGALLDEDLDSIDIPEAEFRTSTLEVTIGDAHPGLGQPIEIRLINLNENDPTSPSPGIEVDFDDVQLVMLPLCPGDVNTTGTTNGQPDGQTNLADLQFYLTLWQGEDSRADLNTTGTTNGQPDDDVNLSDLQFYLTQWQNGSIECP